MHRRIMYTDITSIYNIIYIYYIYIYIYMYVYIYKLK